MTAFAGSSLKTRSVILISSCLEARSAFASDALLPTTLGSSTSLPRIAKRIAVTALKNAAAPRMKTSSDIRSSHSIRSRKFKERLSFLFAVIVAQLHAGQILSFARDKPASS